MASPVVRFLSGTTDTAALAEAGPDAPAPSPSRTGLGAPPQPAVLSEEQENEALLSLRSTYKESWSTQRRALVRRCVKAMEYLKGNHYHNIDDALQATPVGQMLAGTMGADDPNLYQFCDNVYQMLCLSCPTMCQRCGGCLAIRKRKWTLRSQNAQAR